MSGVPPYEQLRAEWADRIIRGDLAPGQKLPPVRTLAVERGLAANTVARAYRELEASGLVRTAGRNGTIVTERAAAAPSVDASACVNDPQRHADDYVRCMRELGLSAGAIEAHVRAALARDALNG